ncbi:2-oxoglutarate ferredoxin oxidoreductase subunit alpha, partial [Streptomyces prasinus]
MGALTPAVPTGDVESPELPSGNPPAGPSDPVRSSQDRTDGAGGKDGKEVRKLDRVIIRFAGDSGDGMQLTGDRFTSETASFGNDLSTLPN